MVSKNAFLKYHHTVPTEVTTEERILPYYSLTSSKEASGTIPTRAQSVTTTLPKLASKRRLSFQCDSLSHPDRPKTVFPECPSDRGVLMTRGTLCETSVCQTSDRIINIE